MEPQYLSHEVRKANIDKMLGRNEQEEFEKGGKPAVLGEKRMFGGREYIKTVDGWKFHGKGTGEKAQQHAAAHKTPTEEKKYDLDTLKQQKHERETKENTTQAKRRATLEEKNKKLHTTTDLKTIGHTKSGKPVYEDFDKKHYENFTKEDHQEASAMHQKIAEEYLNSREYEGGYGVSDAAHEAAKKAKMKHSDASQFHHSSYLSKKNEEIDLIRTTLASKLGAEFKEKSFKAPHGDVISFSKHYQDASTSNYDIVLLNDGLIQLNFQEKKIISGHSLADPTKNYLTTSAHTFTTQRKTLNKTFTDTKKLTQAIDKFFSTQSILLKSDIQKSEDDKLKKAFETLGLDGI